MAPTTQLQIIICGAGIAGLCAAIALAKAGHKVIVLERAQDLSPIGVGLHMPPNATAILNYWGIMERFRDVATTPTGFIYRRYADSSVVARKEMQIPGNATPYWSIKRSDYQRVLREVATELGVEILLGKKVVSLNEDLPSVTTQTGEEWKADLIVAADGIRSQVRTLILPGENVSPVVHPRETYRASAPTALFANDATTKSFFEAPAANLWMGPNRHLMIYPAEGGKILSIAGTHLKHSNEAGGWNNDASAEEIQHSFREFDPVVRNILSQARGFKGWALAEVPRLPSWTSKSGKVVLMGDAAHGMLQFLAQGAATATEDAASLTECLSRVSSTDQIARATKLYERSRKWRCEKIQAQARRNGEFQSMTDGEEQEHRDRKMAGKSLPDDQQVDLGPMWDPEMRKWMYGHDVIAHVSSSLPQLFGARSSSY